MNLWQLLGKPRYYSDFWPEFILKIFTKPRKLPCFSWVDLTSKVFRQASNLEVRPYISIRGSIGHLYLVTEKPEKLLIDVSTVAEILGEPLSNIECPIQGEIGEEVILDGTIDQFFQTVPSMWPYGFYAPLDQAPPELLQYYKHGKLAHKQGSK